MSSIPVARAPSALAAPLAAVLLGVALLFLAGFSHIDAVHDGAHDARHSAALPCH
jgi:cobalt transporter subunit CbtB